MYAILKRQKLIVIFIQVHTLKKLMKDLFLIIKSLMMMNYQILLEDS